MGEIYVLKPNLRPYKTARCLLACNMLFPRITIIDLAEDTSEFETDGS